MLYKTANLYDAIYEGQKDYAAEAKFLHGYIEKCKQSKGKSLLDVCCGTGEHIVYLKKHGYEVEGLDINPEFVEIVKKKLPDAKVHLDDMESFSFSTRYDVVTCLFSSIGYTKTFDKLCATILNMKNHLVPGGVLVIEPWYTPATFKPGHYTGTVQEIKHGKVARMNYWGISNGCAVGDSQFLIANADGIQHLAETHELGLFTNEQYSSAFEKAGLKVVHDEKGPIGRGLFVGTFAD